MQSDAWNDDNHRDEKDEKISTKARKCQFGVLRPESSGRVVKNKIPLGIRWDVKSR